MIKKCIVHANCPDGILSALLLREALPGASIEFVQYGTATYKALKPEEGVLYADFSPPVRTKLVDGKYVVDPEDEKLLGEFRDAGTVILDHHPTAEPIVRAMGDHGVFGNETTCGATLVWDRFWSSPTEDRYYPRPISDKIRDLVTLAYVRDTWRREHPWWREACIQAGVLLFFPWKHWLPLGEIVMKWDIYRDIGMTLLEKREEEVERKIEEAYLFKTPRGTTVTVFEGPEYSSDVAEKIGRGTDLVVAFGYDATDVKFDPNTAAFNDGSPKLRLSTRSHTGFDCAAFAKAHSGGGHKAAAGFTLGVHFSDFNPYEFVHRLVLAYEEKKK